jgi:hypothetical protein
MANVVKLREWKLEGDRISFYKARKLVGSFGFLDSMDEYGKNALEIIAIGDSIDTKEINQPFREFIEGMDDSVIDEVLYKSCRGCMNIFHHKNIKSEYGVCGQCLGKVEQFKRALNVSDMGDSIVGGFGGGRFISSHNFDDRLEIGSFTCSLVRVIASCERDYTLSTLFSDKLRVGKIEKNADNMFTAVYNRQGYPPLPDGLILLYYDIFLAAINGEIDELEYETA